MVFYSTFLMDSIEKFLLIFKAVFQLILCQSQSLLQDRNSLQKEDKMISAWRPAGGAHDENLCLGDLY